MIWWNVGVSAARLAASAAKLIRGGTARADDVVAGGAGEKPEAISEALQVLTSAVDALRSHALPPEHPNG